MFKVPSFIFIVKDRSYVFYYYYYYYWLLYFREDGPLRFCTVNLSTQFLFYSLNLKELLCTFVLLSDILSDFVKSLFKRIVIHDTVIFTFYSSFLYLWVLVLLFYLIFVFLIVSFSYVINMSFSHLCYVGFQLKLHI